MPKINLDQAQEFAKNISSKDNVAVIFDNDSDGFCSGTIMYSYCKKKNAKVEGFPFTRGISEINKESMREFNKIIITDIGPGLIKDYLEALKDKEILYVDHHPKDVEITEAVLEYRSLAEEGEYFPSSRSAYEITEEKKWLGIIGTICDYGHKYPENKEFINSFLKKEGLKLEEFEKKFVYTLSNFLLYFNKNPKEAFEILKKIEIYEEIKTLKKYSKPVQEEIDKTLESFEVEKKKIGKIYYFYFEPKFSVKSVVISMISSRNPEEIFIFTNPMANADKISIGARCQSGKFDMAELLKKCTKDFEWKTAGGHFKASGANILKKDFKKFKENLKKYSDENL